GNIYVMNHLFTVYRIRPCIGEHALLEFRFLLLRWNQVAWFWTIFHNADRKHPTIRRVTEVSNRMVTKRAGTLASDDRLKDQRLQFPGTKKRILVDRCGLWNDQGALLHE